MSIQSEITRIRGNVADALAAIAAKGVTVPQGSNSDDLATLIAAIETGGGDEPVGPTYETYFDDSITVEYGISIASLADLYFAEGETWRVTWDGVEYICTPEVYQGWLWTVGNQSLASTDDGVNEPFLLYNYGGGAMNGNTRTGGTHTLKLEKQTA